MGSFSWFQWVIFLGIGYVVCRIVANAVRTTHSAMLVCTTCGHHGPAKKHVRGSFLIELILWLCLIIPGLIYSVWRLTGQQTVCTSCGASTLVPETSPVGRRLLQDHQATPSA